MQTEKYFHHLEEDIKKNYAIANEARSKGLDPVGKVEIPLARNLAEKAVGLISTLYPQINDPRIVNRIIELEKEYGSLDVAVCLKIAEEIAKEKFCKFSSHLEAIEVGIRVGFAYTTLGVVSSPIEGFTYLKLGKTQNEEEYFTAYFSGPIRSAGTTASCVVLMIIDYLREIFGYAKYDPSEKEIKRTSTELYDFHDRITNLQYLPTEEEAEFLAANLPIQVAGEPSEKLEVSNYKDLPRVDTNFLRSGFCLIIGEGLAQKAAKALRILRGLREKGFKLSDWDFLEKYVELHKKRESGTKDTTPTYIKDLVAGRPIFGHPSRSGAFRFRYGRSRVAGFSAVSIHPATMAISDGFLAVGTQLKIEKPTKGCVISVCDGIDGPIVKLKNGSVERINDFQRAKEVYHDVEEIIYFGDILFPFGDVANRNSVLINPGYVEEWWELELEKIGKKVENKFNVSFDEAINFSKEYRIPLHPSYIYYWTQISYEQLLELLRWLSYARLNKKIILPYSTMEREKFKESKRALELLGIEHDIGIENVIINGVNSKALFANLGFDLGFLEEDEKFIENEVNGLAEKIINQTEREVLSIINLFSEFAIKDKAGEFIGTRMGRPEKAKLRKLTGSPHVLFPVGEEGGRFRSVNGAAELGYVSAEFPSYFCEKCNLETIYSLCETCGGETKKKFYCPICNEQISSEKCEKHGRGQSYYRRRIDIKKYLSSAAKILGIENGQLPTLIKGVRGTSSQHHLLEHLSKGILRAGLGLNVNKDGTIRYDMTELPITHFKPKEIGTSIEKLKEIGYTRDIYGKELIDEDQILELMPHDIILPCSADSGDERADEVFLQGTRFIDLLLEKLYKLPRFYNAKTREDLVGHLSVCMAPHNCAGVISRIIGFSKTQGLLASPYMHAAMRRDCFDYNTYLPIKNNGDWRIRKIGEIVEELNPEKIVDNFGTKERKVDSFLTIGFENKLKEVKINNFTKHLPTSMLEIRTSLGKKIKVTENHKFLVNGNKKRASDLKIGDKIPLPIHIDIDSREIQEINLLELLKDENLMVRDIKSIINRLDLTSRDIILKNLKISKKQFQNFNIRDSYPAKFILRLDDKIKKEIFNIGKISIKRDNVKIPIIIKFNNQLLEVIGLYIAEGHSRSVSGRKGLNQVYIASDDKFIREFVKKTIKESFNLSPSENKLDRVTFSSKILYLFFTKFLEAGSNAKDKRIPYLFLNLPLNKLACILRGYFEGDGSAEKGRMKVSCDSISEGLLYDLEFCLARFGIFSKRYDYEKEPGPLLKNFYIRKKREIPKFRITKLIIGSDFVDNFYKIGFLSERKNNILEGYKKMNPYGMKIQKDVNFVYDPIVSIDSIGEKESYCLNVNTDNHLVVGNSIVTFNCDGDEAAAMLLLDVLINFSREYLPGHRGGTQDAPLVLNGRIVAGEVDDQILDFEVVNKYPLELYQLAELKEHSSKIKIEMVKDRIKKGEDPFRNLNFTHETSDFNKGVLCSSYKQLPTMQEKVAKEMELVNKIRAVDASDVARLIIERHFIRDIRGNLRKFSQQGFRCVKCNSKFRRPPLSGVCSKCNGKIIFTISEGGIVKYLEPALQLANNYDIPVYVKQNLELTKKYIESIFGREETKQADLGKWF
ncbi:DNA polymerase II large subunit [Candidatus Pacearchaeota archaeon]|nr:DNA polymerase II large subunit [Candidatus Pacearchaeota archaeon]